VTQRTNPQWLAALSDPIDEQALTELRETLVRGLRASLVGRVNTDLDALIEDFAQDGLLRVLDNIDSFRGDARFTTWAQKIAINVAFSELRRRRWKNISLQEIVETPDGEEYTPRVLTDPEASPEGDVTIQEVMDIVYHLIETELTDKQRTALVAVMQGGMPLEEVAERMGSNRNALYKLIHDARKRLAQRLQEKANLSTEEVLALFDKL
jgi:RNA polymerase sigma-70 factor (ECF subfamily)